MQQTADVEILWITVDVAAECLLVYGSFFSSAAVADLATDVTAAVDVEMAAVAAAMVDAAANYENQLTFCQKNQRRGN